MVFAHDNVQQYFISPDGSVTSSSEPERMQIVQFSGKKMNTLNNSLSFLSLVIGMVKPLSDNELSLKPPPEDSQGNRPPAYLQVGSWIYPLVPGVSPCFRTSFRAFILPDIHSDVEGT